MGQGHIARSSLRQLSFLVATTSFLITRTYTITNSVIRNRSRYRDRLL